MDKTIQAKTEITDVTLVDLLMVCQALPQDEIEQIEAFTGNPFDPEQLAVSTYSNDGVKWTCRILETGEPIVVAGFFQVGVSTWRSFMLATDKAWAEFGREVTQHCKEIVDQVAGSDEFIRIETMCLASRDKARDWYPSIGLEYEGTLQSYGANGENAVMYVRTNQPSKSIIEI